MKIKVSKSQWEEMGRKAGWIKTADIGSDFQEVYNLLSPMVELLKSAGIGVSIEESYSLPHYNPQRFEDDEYMQFEIRKAENIVKTYTKFIKSINWNDVERAEQAIESLKSQYDNSLLQ